MGRQFRFDESALLHGELGERAAADEGVAVLNLLDDVLRERAAADHVAQVFGNLVGGFGGSVGQEKNGLLRHAQPPAA